MRLKEITEGMIKLPIKMHAKLIKEVRTLAISYMRAKLNLSLISIETSPNVKKTALSMFDKYFKSKYPDVTHRKMELDGAKLHVRDLGVLTKNDLPPSYSKLLSKPLPYEFEFDPSTSLEAHFKFDFKELQDEAAMGMYMRDGKNVVDIELKNIKTINWTIFVEEVEEYLEDSSRLTVLNRLLGRAGDEILEIEGIAEHELTHFMQYLLLSRGHIDQVEGDIVGAKAQKRPTSNYSTEQREFDPHIKSLVKTATKWYNKINRQESTLIDWKFFCKYLVCAITPEFYEDTAKLKPSTQVPGQFTFFKNLKAHDNKTWQRAIKYFTLALEKELVMDANK